MSQNTKINFIALKTILLLLTFNIAQAGKVIPEPVFIDSYAGYATGSLYNARHANDSQSHIYCGVDASVIICGAKDQNGRVGSCTAPVSSNPHLRDMIGAIKPHSILNFGWNRNNLCTHISVGNNSFSLN